jgi:hypothetical protein
VGSLVTDELANRILDLRLDGNDADAATVREYLIALLSELWTGEQGFSGKRPFGNSGWQYDIYIPLMRAGMISGELDERGYVIEMDRVAGTQLVLRAIAALGSVRD